MSLPARFSGVPMQNTVDSYVQDSLALIDFFSGERILSSGAGITGSYAGNFTIQESAKDFSGKVVGSSPGYHVVKNGVIEKHLDPKRGTTPGAGGSGFNLVCSSSSQYTGNTPTAPGTDGCCKIYINFKL